MSGNSMHVHCIGNSHLNSFSFSQFINFNYSECLLFRFFWLGPVIAYNFYEHHFPRVKKEYLNKVDKENDYILFVVGEVDCRLHLPQQADDQGKSDFVVVQECVKRFSRVYEELQEYKIIVFGTHPTTTQGHNMDDPSNPVYGDCSRRNNICVMWNDELKKIADEYKYPYLSLYDYLVDENNVTRMEYMKDYCHIDSIKTKQFLIAEFNKIGVRFE